MKTSEAFRLTKEKLWWGIGPRCGKSKYVCLAASDDKQVFSIVKPIIEELLGTYSFLEGWLFHNHGIRAYTNFEKMQATRHAWVDHLIQHYESIGD